MRRAALAALLALAAASAGCTQASEGLKGLTQEDAAPPPRYEEHRERVELPHEKSFPVEVGPRAAVLNATLTLEARTQGALDAPLSPATLTLELLAPDGTVLAKDEATPREPVAGFVFADFPVNGAYSLRVTGVGASTALDAKPVGASYTLVVELLHA